MVLVLKVDFNVIYLLSYKSVLGEDFSVLVFKSVFKVRISLLFVDVVFGSCFGHSNVCLF